MPWQNNNSNMKESGDPQLQYDINASCIVKYLYLIMHLTGIIEV